MYPTIIIQQPDSYGTEARACTTAALVADIKLYNVPFQELPLHIDSLNNENTLVRGGVEYIRKAMQLCNIPEPNFSSYPSCLEKFLGRKVWMGAKADLFKYEKIFIKPVKTKLFTGFLWTPNIDSFDEYDLEQWRILQTLPEDEPCWFSEPVSFLSENRFFILNGKITGNARYDPLGKDDAECVSPIFVQQAVNILQNEKDVPIAYSLDFGILDNSQPVLIEVNDGWALGLYGKALSPRQYLEFLFARWNQLWKLSRKKC